MLKCSKEAFAACPTRHLCGCPEEAVFTEGSECDEFNRQIGSQRRRTEMAPEQRLIDANALKESVMKEIRHYWNEGEGGYYLAEDVIPDIDLAPTVDAVEVVRCKDCVFYKETEDWDGNKYFACHKRAAVLIMQMKPDDFCSYGERRTDHV